MRPQALPGMTRAGQFEFPSLTQTGRSGQLRWFDPTLASSIKSESLQCLRAAPSSAVPGILVLFWRCHLIAVISELWPYPDRCNDYFALAEELRPHLNAIDGFISAERFESPNEPGKYVSLSFWRDEAALSHWRNLEKHRMVMENGRGGILRDYRIRVTRVLYEYTMSDRTQAPKDSRARLG